VRDSGIGFDKAEAGRLFDAFYITKHGGTGMGLAICRSIIDWHRGRIWAAPGGRREARSSASRCPPPRAPEGRLARCVRPLIAPRQLSRI